MSESQVEAALELMLDTQVIPEADRVCDLVEPKQPEVPQMEPYAAHSVEYDDLREVTEDVLS